MINPEKYKVRLRLDTLQRILDNATIEGNQPVDVQVELYVIPNGVEGQPGLIHIRFPNGKGFNLWEGENFGPEDSPVLGKWPSRDWWLSE